MNHPYSWIEDSLKTLHRANWYRRVKTIPSLQEKTPVIEPESPIVEETPVIEPETPIVEETPVIEPETPIVQEIPVIEEETPVIEPETPIVEENLPKGFFH